MLPRVLLIVGLITDVILTFFLATLIPDIGVLAFVIIVLFFFGITIGIYFMMNRNWKGPRKI